MSRNFPQSLLISLILVWIGVSTMGVFTWAGHSIPGSDDITQDIMNEEAISMHIKSSAFEQGGLIPSEYTCEGKNISPQVSWGDFPENSKTFVLICDDPDAPVGIWTHWVIYNIPKETTSLSENTPCQPKLPDGSLQGLNSYKVAGYRGPCPPSGMHRYFFKIYALDAALSIPEKATKQEVEEAMRGHILAQAELMGRYQKRG